MIARAQLGATTTLKRTSSGVDVIASYSPQTAAHTFAQKRRTGGFVSGSEAEAEDPLPSPRSLQQQIESLQREPTQEEIDALVAKYDDGSDDESIASDSQQSQQDEEDEIEDIIMKVLVVGNARCGKTSTIRRFVSDAFSDVYASTVGADFIEKVIEYDATLRIHLQLWDIAGQDRFAKLTRAYFREAKGALIVCDITRENTIEAVETWKNELDACCQDLNDGNVIPVVMIANKSDLLTDPMQALSIGVNMQKCVTQNQIIEWFRASAKSGEHVDDAFQCLIDRMVQDHRQSHRKSSSSASSASSSVQEENVIRLTPAVHHHEIERENGMCDCN